MRFWVVWHQSPDGSRHYKDIGHPHKASLDNGVKLSAKGELKGAGDKPVSAEQMELARLRTQLARVTWGRLKEGRQYWQRFETRRQAMDEVIDLLTFYNHR